MRQRLCGKVCGTFEVRNSKRQKSAFLRWVQEMLREEGIPSRVSIDRCVVKNRNLIIGDLEKAATVVTAHYDTPKAMPFPFATYLDHFWLSLFSQSWGIILALAIPQFLLAYLSVSLFPRYLLFLLTFVLFFFTVFWGCWNARCGVRRQAGRILPSPCSTTRSGDFWDPLDLPKNMGSK